MGVSIITSGHEVLTHQTLHCSIKKRSYQMFSQAMNRLDRVAMTFVVLLAATPILSIAANAAFL